jgi:hypothetical protein
MSKIKVDQITDGAGTGAPDFPNGLTGIVPPESITNALNATGSAPIYACRARVNFNGTGAVAIRAAGNVTSITDNGVGLYTINFKIAMPDTSFTAICSGGDYVSGTALLYTQERNAPALRTVNSIAVATGFTNTGSASLQDNATSMVAVFR